MYSAIKIMLTLRIMKQNFLICTCASNHLVDNELHGSKWLKFDLQAITLSY